MEPFDDPSGLDDTGVLVVRHGMERRILSVFRAYGADPRVGAAARALSWAGEHGALWLAAGLAGAAVDGARRGAWLRGTALTAGAHAVSMGVKRVVRRPRPAHVEPLVRTAGRYSFPSSHATSAAAAAVAFGALGACGVSRGRLSTDTRLGHDLTPVTLATRPTRRTYITHAARAVRATRLLPPLAVAMCLSRLVVGVHYPSDVAAGAALGALTARFGARWIRGGAHD
ncbi:5'-phosphoribosyl-monophospho-decaprenol phosphatase [Streptomyces sp. TLI_55]|uniref:phosphatase PAP2 family protein n=1 Tax=Streptomyces sp. TLI_55 TaxID=1938861 RepID=UPI000BC48FC2|nr:phosphatase PAP2 family protein [Streptomyces sp. TLI_55]SNX63528.1 5'-phosphoribosyl-monophospho-decaprenol phosphatase [Streptomyces sp. TLI_55]